MKHLKFLLLHGSFNGPNEKWLHWLEKELKGMGQDVVFPQFPVETWNTISEQGKNYKSKVQNVESWIEMLRPLLDTSVEDCEYIITAHSTGPAFSLHAIQKLGLTVSMAIWVAPFLEKLNKAWQVDVVNTDFVNKSVLNIDKLRKSIRKSIVIYSDNDKYVGEEYSLAFAKLFSSETILMSNAGHMNNSAGFITFPLVLELIKDQLL